MKNAISYYILINRMIGLQILIEIHILSSGLFNVMTKNINIFFKDLENYNHLQKYVTSASDGTNGECYNFITDFKDENYDEKWFFGDNGTAYFVIYSIYKDGVLELQWGLGRVPIKE